MENIFRTKQTFINAFEQKLHQKYHVTVLGSTTKERFNALIDLIKPIIKERKTISSNAAKQQKQTIYFSIEFLIGRLITSNLSNLGIYNVVKSAFYSLGIDINEIENFEADAGLGNGGLGRLAACFLDSAAYLKLPLHGNSIRYKNGYFKQQIKDNRQVEINDDWLKEPFAWEERNEKYAVDIPFYGYIENGEYKNQTWVRAVPYDVSIIGASSLVTNTLRLWHAEPSSMNMSQDESYLRETAHISDNLYPDDSSEYGKKLRLKQQYFFSAAGIKTIINSHKSQNRSLYDLPNFYSVHINDTHPTLVIPELMRILMDEEGMSYADAWSITTRTCAFTNHTILQEALEKWPIWLFKQLLPRIFEIVCEIDRRFNIYLTQKRVDEADRDNMLIIGHQNIRMANICIVASYSVNGVAALHTEILISREMRGFYKLYPQKFNNKTNGVAQRRWLFEANPELCELLDQTISKSYRKDFASLINLEKFIDDHGVQYQFRQIKRAKKITLAKQIKLDTGIDLDPDSIFDIQVKRLHEYKRQLLNILHIIYLYQRLKTDYKFKENFYKTSFIFGAKAAPSYYIAKKIIQLINLVAKKVNDDDDTKHHLKVVFIPNYNVTYAELIMPACDISEQISTTTKEASGTGNMKFMMNGAVTLGTLDGANVEISQLVGSENMILFGMKADEILHLDRDSYHPYEYYMNDIRIHLAIDFFESLSLNKYELVDIKNALINSDSYYVLKDFDSYVLAHERANNLYKNKNHWSKIALTNIAKSSFFSSDRTIYEYNKDIWKLKKINI